jgi:hypothetical protein
MTMSVECHPVEFEPYPSSEKDMKVYLVHPDDYDTDDDDAPLTPASKRQRVEEPETPYKYRYGFKNPGQVALHVYTNNFITFRTRVMSARFGRSTWTLSAEQEFVASQVPGLNKFRSGQCHGCNKHLHCGDGLGVTDIGIPMHKNFYCADCLERCTACNEAWILKEGPAKMCPLCCLKAEEEKEKLSLEDETKENPED